MRVVLSMPDAVPERAGGNAATATPLTGAVFSPRPTPTTSNASSIRRSAGRLADGGEPSAPAPMHSMPAVITTRGPRRLFRWPTNCETRKNASASAAVEAGDEGSSPAHGLEVERHDEQQRVHAERHQPGDSERSREGRAPQEFERQQRAWRAGFDADEKGEGGDRDATVPRMIGDVQPQCDPSMAAKAKATRPAMAST